MAAIPCSPRLLLILVGLVGLLAVSASGDTVDVVFVMTQRAQYGQVIKIVGNGTELSNWTPSKAENMTWTTGDVWVYGVTLNKGVVYEYKATVVNYDTGACNCWMPRANQILKVPSDYSNDNYVVTVVWSESCGNPCYTDACSIGSACPSTLDRLINSII